MNEEISKTYIMIGFLCGIRCELGTEEVIGMFWMEELYHHICVLHNSFCRRWRFQVKLEIKVTVINQARKGGRLDKGRYYKNEVFLEIFEILNQ